MNREYPDALNLMFGFLKC